MGTAVISKSTATFDRLDSDNQLNERSVTFVLAHDDSGQIYRTVYLSYSDWVELGSPDQITCTITPGPMPQN